LRRRHPDPTFGLSCFSVQDLQLEVARQDDLVAAVAVNVVTHFLQQQANVESKHKILRALCAFAVNAPQRIHREGAKDAKKTPRRLV